MKKITLLAILSGILFNSWILGLFLNPKVIPHSYFSTLEAPGRPYNWLFIGSDIIVAILILIISSFLIYRVKHLRKITLIYGFYGIALLLDSLVPITNQCSTTVAACGSSLSQVLSIHDIFSLIQFSIIIYLLVYINKNLPVITSKDKIVNKLLVFSWSLSFILLVLSVKFDILTGLSQGIFTILTSLALVLIPVRIESDVVNYS